MLSTLLLFVYLLGIVNAAHAVMYVRTAQGAIAWSMALLTFPLLAVPLYWILGRNRFQGYIKARQQANSKNYPLVQAVYGQLIAYHLELPDHLRALQTCAAAFSHFSFTHSNAVRLLINGEHTFYAMREAIQTAQHYILMQFYIINDDEVGQEFQQLLIQRAREGIQVFFIYDEIGCHHLPTHYLTHMKEYGIQVHEFGSTRGWGNHFQINFRNHRKIVLTDGVQAIIGGLNLGNEYLGRDPAIGDWRDTAILLQGPSVQGVQASFAEDWFWATEEVLALNWQVTQAEFMNATVLILPTGPADRLQNCSLFFVTAFMQAQTRLWIASPYFVPDEVLVNALQAAAIRGVDVRILIPDRPDHLLVFLASFSYYAEMEAAGVKLYRYNEGFMHQKVVLIDDQIAAIGTVNLDNRSFQLNFEISAFILDSTVIASVQEMLEKDFLKAVQVDRQEYEQKSIGFKVLVQVSRLLAPIL